MATNNKGSTSTLLHEVLELQKISIQNNTRLETKMDKIEKHQEKQDEQLEKLTEIITNQKLLEHNQIQIQKAVTEHSKRLLKLEHKDGATALALWKKIIGIVITTAVTGFIGFITGVLHFGGK